MKKLLIILGIVVLLLVVVGAFMVFNKSNSSPNQNTNNTQFPVSQNNGSGNGNTQTNTAGVQLLHINTSNGNPIITKNFEIASSTIKDPSGDVYYYIAGGLNENTTHAPYQIFYDSQHQYFGITLYKEPLGVNRKLAENELMQALGISQSQMCGLNYDISAGP